MRSAQIRPEHPPSTKMSQTRHANQPPIPRSSNAQWQHGVITPMNSPREDMLEVGQQELPLHTSRLSGQTQTGSNSFSAQSRPPVGQMLPPPAKGTPITAANVSTTTDGKQTFEPFANDVFSLPSDTTMFAQNSDHSQSAAHPSVSHASEDRHTESPAPGHPDFPLGIVDPTGSTHASKQGPPRWPGNWIMSANDYDLTFGSVNSPAMVIGLPFGGTIETCSTYRPEEKLPEQRKP